MHFLKEFGLILFVYSIGLQVGPGFFSSFRKGGVTLNKLAVLVVALGVATTVALYYITGLSMTTMVGVMSGAVTNTPGLGAAQQAFSDMHAGADAPDIATGYAVAYPLGVVGAILTLIGLRYLLRIDVKREEAAAGQDSDAQKDLTTRRLSVEIVNAAVNGKTVDIPSYQVKPGDVIAVKETKKDTPYFAAIKGVQKSGKMPKWLDFDTEKLEGKIIALPTREDIDSQITEQMIVELYSK